MSNMLSHVTEVEKKIIAAESKKQKLKRKKQMLKFFVKKREV